MSDLAILRGYAIVFNSLSVDLGGFREIVRPQAVTRTINESVDVRALVDHDTAKIIGRVSAGTLRLRPDPTGLEVEISVPDTSVGRDVVTSISRGDLSGMSFAFKTVADEWFAASTGQVIREMLDMIVLEASVVAFPAYPDTEVDVVATSRIGMGRASTAPPPERAGQEFALWKTADGQLARHDDACARRDQFLAVQARCGRGVRVRFDGAGRPTIFEPPRLTLPPRAPVRTNWAPWAEEESRWP
jgi:HK97 family phage prohead protease